MDYLNKIEPNAIEQYNDALEKAGDLVTKSALMPDAHLGYSVPIGSVIDVTGNNVFPSWVGNDIGCGMLCVKTYLKPDFIRENGELIHKLGEPILAREVSPEITYLLDETVDEHKKFKKTIDNFIDYQKFYLLKSVSTLTSAELERSMNTMGTVGGGNHFVEMGILNDEVYITVHTGSRTLGAIIYNKYLSLAEGIFGDKEAPLPLSFFGGDYLKDMMFAVEFAKINRMRVLLNMFEVFKELRKTFNIRVQMMKPSEETPIYENVHNYAELVGSVLRHRKGATKVTNGKKVIIPLNMAKGVLLADGIENDEFMNSCAHGAGRKFSRGQAKRTTTLEEYREATKNVITVDDDTNIEEGPAAYKDPQFIIDSQVGKNITNPQIIESVISWKSPEEF